MTTLVTGATGFVGSHVARQLVAAGDSVRALARPGAQRKMLDGVAIEWAEGDLRDEASLDRALKDIRRVFHVCEADGARRADDRRGDARLARLRAVHR